jgi:hypothetical protein
MDNALGTDPFAVPEEASNWGETVPAREGPFNPRDFIRNYRKEANKAASTYNSKLIDSFVDASRRIFARFAEFAKQAVEIAVSKFLVELCAMIIAGISAALMKKHSRGVEISTPGVFYNSNGAAPTQAQSSPSNQGSLWGNNNNSSFDGGWNRPGQNAW